MLSLAILIWRAYAAYKRSVPKIVFVISQDAKDGPSIIDHDISFRPGIGADGSDTYTPRALIYDFKTGFGSLRKVNALYETENQEAENSLWYGHQQIHTTPPVELSPYQAALESGLPTSQLQSRDVRYWSDYNRVYYHPRSLVQLSTQSLTSQISAFESFSAGIELYCDLDQEIGGLLDRDVRFFAEECDDLQGFQVLGSSDDAWGGFMTKYIEALEDDYGKKSVWVWSLENDQRNSRLQHLNRITNNSQSLVGMLDHISANIRVSSIPSKLPPYINLETTSLWSTSALSASVIETATLPLRLRQGTTRNSRMAFVTDFLNNNNNRKLWNLTARAQPAAHEMSNGNTTTAGQSLNGSAAHDARVRPEVLHLERDQSESYELTLISNLGVDLTPKLPQPHTVFPSLQSSTHQPVPRSCIFGLVESHRSSQVSHRSQRRAVLNYESTHRTPDEETLLDIYETPLAFPVLDSFPGDIFRFPTVLAPNDLQPNSQIAGRSGGQVKTLAMAAALSTKSSTKTEVLTMRDLVVGRAGRTMNLVDSNEREGLYDELTKVAEAYTYGYEDDFSEDDDQDD